METHENDDDQAGRLMFATREEALRYLATNAKRLFIGNGVGIHPHVIHRGQYTYQIDFYGSKRECDSLQKILLGGSHEMTSNTTGQTHQWRVNGYAREIAADLKPFLLEVGDEEALRRAGFCP